MSDEQIRGACLCGTVSFAVTPPFQKMVHCHCSRCRKASGTGHATNLAVEPSRFAWLSGESAIVRYELPSAARFGKWFCGTCGCPTPRLSRNGAVMMIPAGALDASAHVAPTDHLFWDDRAAWDCAAGSLPTHTDYPPSWK